MKHRWFLTCLFPLVIGLSAAACAPTVVPVPNPTPVPTAALVATDAPGTPSAEDATAAVTPTPPAVASRSYGFPLASGLTSGSAVDPGTATVDAPSPERTVQGFYDWYLDYAQRQGSPIVARAYRSSDYLTPGFVQQVDKALASYSQGGFDPFLCAQDVPASLQVGTADVTGDQASVVVRSSLQDHWLSVDLVRVNGQWKMSAISCAASNSQGPGGPGSNAPDRIVQDFYDWYLGYVRDTGNPMVDGAYKKSPYLTEAASERIGQIWSGFGDGPRYDPVLCGQDAPERFAVDPAQMAGDEAQVFVRLLWSDSPTTSQTVTLRQEGGGWKIDDLTCAVQTGPVATAKAHGKVTPAATDDDITAGWQVFRDTEYGYEIKYPPLWTSFDPNPTTPDVSSPVVRTTAFAPPDAPKGLAPVAVEVYKATDEAFLKAYPGTGKFAEVTIGGMKARFDRGDPAAGMAYYVFQSPRDPNVRVVFRYDSNAAPVVKGLAELVGQMVATLKFSR